MRLGRALRHLFTENWTLRSAFPRAALQAIERAVTEQEKRHSGELRFAVEGGLPLVHLLRGRSARERALELFGALRVWDTEQNSGVLIYLLLADRAVEIVADRGIERRVGAFAWEAICGDMEREFARGEFTRGTIAGIQAVSEMLTAQFPAGEVNPNELPDRPVVL